VRDGFGPPVARGPACLTLVTDDTYWSEQLHGTRRDWLEPGYHVLLALHARRDTGQLRPVSSQGIFALDGPLVHSVWDGPLAGKLDGSDRATLEREIAGEG
jgi:hypothetical protein